MNAPLPVFLSAYDPAELPGGTLDPLGFTGGYLALADLLFPGMTAAASQATYLPMLCAGLFIAETEGGVRSGSVAAARKQRIDITQRFERLWALACALQVDVADVAEGAEDELTRSKTADLRGIRYVKREVERLTQARAKEAGSEFSLLAQQYRYGAFGIYSGVAEELHLLDKSTLSPTPSVGQALGRTFIEATTDTAERKELLRACLDKSAKVRVATLRAWGTKAYCGAPLRGQTQTLLREALLSNQERADTFMLLQGVWQDWQGDWSDGELLSACQQRMSPANNPRLFATLEAAQAYDAFLRDVMLIFERVLWRCHQANDAAVAVAVFDDEIVDESASRLPERASALLAKANQLFSLGRRDLQSRGSGVLQLAQHFAGGLDAASAVRAVVKRHAQIQGGKLERGRPKQAWIEEKGNELVLTNRSSSRSFEPKRPEQLRAPDWRFRAALSFLGAVGNVTQGEAA